MMFDNVVFDKEAGRLYNEHMHKIIRANARIPYRKYMKVLSGGRFQALGGLRHDVPLRGGLLSVLNRPERTQVLYKGVRTRGCDVSEA